MTTLNRPDTVRMSSCTGHTVHPAKNHLFYLGQGIRARDQHHLLVDVERTSAAEPGCVRENRRFPKMTGHLHFSGSEQSCVLMADIADSTKTVFQIKSSDKLRLFYNIFITELSDIASRFEAKVIKNAGDGIICYFPKTADISDISAFRRVLHTGLQMIGYRSSLNISLQKEGLPPISYRISADYGRHEMVTDNESHVCDIFSQTINICAKIKLQRVPNQFVIGGDLYQIVKSIPEFCFKQRGEFVVDPKRAYPLYTVSESLDAKSRIGESRIRAETPFAQALKVFSLNKSRREFAKDRNLTGGD